MRWPRRGPTEMSGERRGDDLRVLTSLTGFFDELRLDGRPGRRPGRLRAARASPPDRHGGAGPAAPRAPVPQGRGSERVAPLGAPTRRRRPVSPAAAVAVAACVADVK